MIQLGKRLGLALEAFEEFVLFRAGLLIGPDDLDRHVAFQAGVERLVDRGHAPLAQGSDDMISSKILTCEVVHLTCLRLLRCAPLYR